MTIEEIHEEDLVSIITPAYNSEKYIEECMNSVISQTYQNWEMIIVNDQSTDSTASIVEKFAAKETRIKLYNQPTNGGAAAARNKAISMSKGRFVAFLDSDDMWKPNKLERQISFMIKNSYGFVFTAYEIYKKSNKVFQAPKRISYDDYLKNTIIGCLTVIMDKKKIGNIQFEKGHLEDVLTWMSYLKKGNFAYGLNESLAVYRVTENSVSSNKFKNALRYYHCLRKHQNLSVVKSIYCEANYLINAIKKRLF